MVVKECNSRAGVYKVQTFGTTQCKKIPIYHAEEVLLRKALNYHTLDIHSAITSAVHVLKTVGLYGELKQDFGPDTPEETVWKQAVERRTCNTWHSGRMHSPIGRRRTMLNAVFAGIISTDARNNALNAAVYYASEPEIYHRLKYDFRNSFDDFTLVVPDWTTKKARLTVTGNDGREDYWNDNYNQIYRIDDKEATSCYSTQGDCSVPTADITDKIPIGLHKISAKYIRNPHTMIFEVLTSPLPPRTLVLYGPNYNPWINETGKSMTIGDLNSLIAGNAINTTA